MAMRALVTFAFACTTVAVPAFTPTPAAERIVGVTYSTWFPSAVRFSSQGGCTWGEPALGAYESANRTVLRQHALWLRDAGVDFVLVDWSNDVPYEPACAPAQGLSRRDLAGLEAATVPLFEVFASVPGAPRVAILAGSPANRTDYDQLPGGRLACKATQIYNRFVRNATVGGQYFRLDGKPLLVDYVGTPSMFRPPTWAHTPGPWADARFTTRHISGFVTSQAALVATDAEGHRVSTTGLWSWEDRGNSSFPVVGGHPEFQVITAAYRGDPCGWPCPENRAGRANGSTFLEKWRYARAIGPRVALVQSFNQWAGCARSPGENQDAEFSTDIEPMAGGHGDTYLRMLGEQARLFKAGH